MRVSYFLSTLLIFVLVSHNGHHFLSVFTGGQLSISMMLLIGQLNNSVTGSGIPCSRRVKLICNEAVCGSAFVSIHFFEHLL